MRNKSRIGALRPTSPAYVASVVAVVSGVSLVPAAIVGTLSRKTHANRERLFNGLLDTPMTRLGKVDVIARVGRAIRGLIDRPELPSPPPQPIRVVGHRGAPRELCENTIASFERAIELGADAIELDVCVTRDRQIVVWHDSDPDGAIGLVRQAGREELAFVPDVPALMSKHRRRVGDLDLEEMRQHYAYHERGPLLHDLLNGDSDAKTPFLMFEEALAWARSEPRLRTLFVDVKLLDDETDAAAHLFDQLRAACGARDWRDDLVVAMLCTEREILETLLERAELSGLPDCLRLYADFELPGVLEDAALLGIRNVSMGSGERAWADFRRELVKVINARQAGELDSVVVWTVSDPEQLAELVQLRVDAILTDDIAALRALLPRSG